MCNAGAARRLAFALIVVASLGVDVADAQLIQTTAVLTNGSGIGGVNTVLTVQGNPTESGCRLEWRSGRHRRGSLPAGCPWR